MNDRQTVLEIDIENFKHNIKEVKKLVGSKEIMYVMKANAYGTYLNKNIDVIKDFKIIGVAIVKEAIELRRLGFKGEIFLLNQPYIEDIENIIKYDVTVGVADYYFIKELCKDNNKFRIHLEIETGMGRTGININELDKVLDLLKRSSNITIEGIYTHLAVADSNLSFTLQQMDIFKDAVSKIKLAFPNIKYIHAEASNGIQNINDSFCNLVRPGMILYGYNTTNRPKYKLDLKPVAILKSKISFVKEVPINTSISYGRTFITKRESKIATVGIGYADGIRRILSNNGRVVVNDNIANIVGTICMDSFMIDVTDINDVRCGDEVYIWDNNLITLDEIASNSNTINYEILSTISNRVPRKFID